MSEFRKQKYTSVHGSSHANLEYGFGPRRPYLFLISSCLCFISAFLSSCLVFVLLACLCILASNLLDPKFSHLQQQNRQTRKAMMIMPPTTAMVMINAWKFIQQSPQRASFSGQSACGGRMVLTGYVTHDFVLIHHKHDTFFRHSSQLVPFFNSQAWPGAEVWAKTVAKPKTNRRAGRIIRESIIQQLRLKLFQMVFLKLLV